MNFNVRCRNHDYHSRCIYMITILEEEGTPPLMQLTGRHVNGKLEPIHYVQPLGKVVYDRIAYRAGAKDAFYRYIKDNPYRYVIRKMHPEFFGNTLDLKIGDKWLQLYGNFLLLDNPVKEYVQISSKPEKRRDLPQRIAAGRGAPATEEETKEALRHSGAKAPCPDQPA